MYKRKERWRPVVGYEGLYEVSDRGRVRSVDRYVTSRTNVTKLLEGRMKKPSRLWNSDYVVVALSREGKTRRVSVHHLVLEAFAGPRPQGYVTCHRNGDPRDNRIENLRWGTQSDNSRDALRHGTHPAASKTHCPQGHEYTPENTRYNKHTGYRLCKTCHRIREHARYHGRRQQAG